MKKLLFLLALCVTVPVCTYAQGSPPWTIQEIDGSPKVVSPTLIKVTNGTLSCSGKTCTITTGGGGGGCAPPGTAGRVLYDDGAGGCASTSGFTASATAVAAGSGALTATRPKIVTSLDDSGGNELIKVTATASAVNEITLANAATGANPTITASGGDSDVGFDLLVKGAGVYRLLASASGPSDFRLFEDADNGSNYVSLIPAASLGSNFVLTLPSATDTLVGKATTDTFTNKTIAASSNSLGGVTMSLGSDADGDVYYRASNVLTRLGIGTAAQCLKVNAGATAPEWAACGSGITIGTTTIASGTATRLLYETAGNVVGEVSGFTSDGTNVTAGSANLRATSPRFTTDVSDSNGNEVFKITATGSAVNEFTIANAATGGSPTITASGGDSDVGINFTGKGLGGFAFTSTATTGTGTSSGFSLAVNSLTTGTGANFASSSVTSGSVVNIASTSTAAASSTLKGLNIAISGANGTTAQTVTGAAISVTNTNATSGTNVALSLTASGATTANTALNITAGQALFADGATATPAIARSAATGTGFRFATNTAIYSTSGSDYIVLDTTGINLRAAARVGFYSSGVSSADAAFVRSGTNTIRASDASTGAGNLIIGTSAGAIGTSGVGVLAFTLSTAPSSSPADTVQMYSNDAAAGAHELYTRNEAAEITRLTGLAARNSAAFDKTSDTTLANVTGLTRNVEASRTYAFTAVLQTTANVAGGVKFAVSGTATATAISYEGVLLDTAAVVAQTRATALDTTVCALTTATAGTCTIRGVIQVNAAGTLTIQFAQNASNGTASSVLANQFFQLTPIG